MMKIKVKKIHPDAKLPVSAHNEDAGFDIVAVDDGTPVFGVNSEMLYIEYKTGLTVEPPEGYYIEMFPRSSITKTGLILANSIGVIDNGYRGEILVRFKQVPLPSQGSNQKPVVEHPMAGPVYHKGDKIAQLVVRKKVEMDFEEVSELSDTDRSNGGFGSTGR